MARTRAAKPPRLKPGGTIFVTAPSSYPVYPSMKLAEGIELLRKLGYRVVVGETVKRALRTWYFSAPPEHKARELLNAFKDPSVDVIVCARGGIGALHLLDKLDYDVIRENPKLVIGYSDITALHEAVYAKAGVPGLQAAMPGPRPHIGFGEEDRERVFKYSVELALRVASGEELELRNPPDAPMPKTINPGRARGTGIGGNIIMHVLLAAAGYVPPHEGSVLFLENIEEPAWRVDDYLQALALAGLLSSPSGIVYGEFPEPETYRGPSPSIEEVIATRTRQYTGAPSFTNYSCCHGRYVLPFPVGTEVEVDADEGVVRMLEPVAE